MRSEISKGKVWERGSASRVYVRVEGMSETKHKQGANWITAKDGELVTGINKKWIPDTIKALEGVKTFEELVDRLKEEGIIVK
jgi:hypothetical protein